MSEAVAGNFEREVLNRIRTDYESKGYEFITEPRGPDLPSFLEGVVPDAIARKGTDNVIIEVKSSARFADRSQQVKFLAKEVPKHSGWRFDLVVAATDSEFSDSRHEPTKQKLKIEVARLERLAENGDSKALLPFAWGLMEAATRLLVLNETKGEARRYMPSSVVEALVSDGYVSDDDGKHLLKIGRLRSLISHGFTETEVEGGSIEFLIRQLNSLINQIPNRDS